MWRKFRDGGIRITSSWIDEDGEGETASLAELWQRIRAEIARSLLSDFLPIQGARGLGLYLVDRIGPLRRALMREGVTPALAAPRLMRGEAL